MNGEKMDDAPNVGVDDATLYSYIDGDADPSTVEKIESLPAALLRAERLRREHMRLRAVLHRVECPDTDVLLDHASGWLPLDQKRSVAEHLEVCPRCAEEVAVIAGFPALIDAPEPQTVVDRLHEVIATLVSGPGFVGQLQPVALRGGEGAAEGDGEPWVFEANGVQIVIEVGPDPEFPDRREIAGQVIGDGTIGLAVEVRRAAQTADPADVPSLATAEGQGKGEDAEDEPIVSTTEVDEYSSFLVSGLKPMTYLIVLRGGPSTIRIQDLLL